MLTTRMVWLHMFIRFDMIHERENRSFQVPQPTFLFPLETLLRLSHTVLRYSEILVKKIGIHPCIRRPR